MKKHITIIATALTLISTATFAQEINPSQVPSVVANSFKKEFPKATDIEWELDGDDYNVEFEIGWGTDHEIWYDAAGKILKHKEEIAKSDLPEAIISKIASDFPELKIDGVKKITEGDEINYSVELENFTEEWKVIFSGKGDILDKIKD
ncbi:hypothetical protein J2X69_000934 [Algoriphagus sp. 4150]|uniref:PepSY-like domain-containing protein n=1 Tax=Algoriphagus sp. 4150 TaxID=2817756 RepID=UPI002854B439|nr:PepSY-like domain-containing protein [Algoriphagus sp. 4150]MDR7128602.1 hypothetical protein [Algoriphagus sp. 4150]